MIELMQMSEMRGPLGRAPMGNLALGGAAFAAELDPAVEAVEAALEEAAVPDEGGLLAVVPVVPFPDPRIRTEPQTDPAAGAIPVQAAGEPGAVRFDQTGVIAEPDGSARLVASVTLTATAPAIAAEMVAAIAPGHGAGHGAVEVRATVQTVPEGFAQSIDPISKNGQTARVEPGVLLAAPNPDARTTATLAREAADVTTQRPEALAEVRKVAARQAEARQGEGPVGPPAGPRVDPLAQVVPGVALVIPTPAAPLVNFPMSRQTATEFRLTAFRLAELPSNESIGTARPAPIAAPRIGEAVPLADGSASASASVADIGSETDTADRDVPVEGPVAQSGPPKDLSTGGSAMTAAPIGEKIAPDPPFARDPSNGIDALPLTPRQETAQPLAPAVLREATAAARIAPEAVTQQVAHLIVSHAEDRAELLLEPVELGRLRFEITQRGEGVQIVVMAERPETMDLLRRHADQLLDDLQAMGFSGSALGFGNWDGPPEQDPRPAPDTLMAEQPLPAPVLFPVAPLPRIVAGGLDLRL